jgi:glycogen debranching enzyme
MESYKIAKRDLEANIVPSKSGPLFCCGPSHFHFFWLRDFSFSVPGLLEIGQTDLVRRHLEMSLDYMRPDGLMARSFDVINPKLRVVLGIAGIHASKFWPYTSHDLKPEYYGENLTIASDSNILVLDACLKYVKATGDTEFLRRREPQIKKAFERILELKRGDFLFQPAFSDWQDSARRKGHTFFLNLSFYKLLLGLKDTGLAWAKEIDSEEWLGKLWAAFFSSEEGLFKSEAGSGKAKQFSLEGILLAIEGDFFKKYIFREKLWENLKNSPLYKPMPGLPVWPEYAWSDVSWTTKFVGLRHYHDGFYWSWLLGECLKVASLMGDRAEADRIAGVIENLVTRNQTVHEIYALRGDQLVPARTRFYRSEYGFSWGAAKLIEGLSVYRRNSN